MKLKGGRERRKKGFGRGERKGKMMGKIEIQRLWGRQVGLLLCFSNQNSSVSHSFTFSPPSSSLSTLLSLPPNASSVLLPSIPSSFLSSLILPLMANTSTPFPLSAPLAPPLFSSQITGWFSTRSIKCTRIPLRHPPI